jgi:hypothetical protein
MSSASGASEDRPTAENLAVLTKRLEQLVAQIMNETDPVKYDLLGSEIWRVLGELERLRDQHLH